MESEETYLASSFALVWAACSVDLRPLGVPSLGEL